MIRPDRSRRRPAHRYDRLAGLAVGAWIAAVIVVLAFWAAVIIVAVHFLAKVW